MYTALSDDEFRFHMKVYHNLQWNIIRDGPRIWEKFEPTSAGKMLEQLIAPRVRQGGHHHHLDP